MKLRLPGFKSCVIKCDNPLCRRSVARRRSFQHNNCVSFSVPLLVSGSKLIRFKKKSKKVSWDFSIGKVVYLVVQNSFCVSIFKKSIVWNDLILLYQTLSALDINSKNISCRNNEHVNLSDAGQVGRYLWNLYSAYGNGSRWWKVWTKVCFHLKLKQYALRCFVDYFKLKNSSSDSVVMGRRNARKYLNLVFAYSIQDVVQVFD